MDLFEPHQPRDRQFPRVIEIIIVVALCTAIGAVFLVAPTGGLWT